MAAVESQFTRKYPSITEAQGIISYLPSSYSSNCKNISANVNPLIQSTASSDTLSGDDSLDDERGTPVRILGFNVSSTHGLITAGEDRGAVERKASCNRVGPRKNSHNRATNRYVHTTSSTAAQLDYLTQSLRTAQPSLTVNVGARPKPPSLVPPPTFHNKKSTLPRHGPAQRAGVSRRLLLSTPASRVWE